MKASAVKPGSSGVHFYLERFTCSCTWYGGEALFWTTNKGCVVVPDVCPDVDSSVREAVSVDDGVDNYLALPVGPLRGFPASFDRQI